MIDLLEKPTLTVVSGGEWYNSTTGRAERKLHLHWRLRRVAYSPGQHELLREARELATKLVGADHSNISIVHPLRWPGSWHRKNPAQPRLAHISEDTDNEIELAEALTLLRTACGHVAASPKPPLRNGGTNYPPVPFEDVAAALAIIPGTDDRAEWIRVGEAAYAANHGAFEAWDLWSRKAPTKYGGTEAAWRSFEHSPPRNISFGTLVRLARDVDPNWRAPSWDVHASVGVTLDDFLAYMPAHAYVYTPTREIWPAASVDARMPPPEPRLRASAGSTAIKPSRANDLGARRCRC